MKWFVFLIVLLTFTRDVRAQDDDDMGDGAYGADDGGDDEGYDAPADGDDDGGYDSPTDGDDDMGGDESRARPEYVSTIERDEEPNNSAGDDNAERVDSSQRVALAVLPQPALEPTSLPTPFGSVSLFRARMPADHSMTSSDVHHRARRSIASGMAGSVLSRSKRSGHRDGGGGGGVVGPVHTYIRTDYDGNYRWGARHYVGSSYGRGL